MAKLLRISPFLCASMLLTVFGQPVSAQDCSSVLDDLQRTLEQGDVPPEQKKSLNSELDQARQLADDNDSEGCTAAAAELQSAMLQIDGIDHDMLCDRTQSEEDVGEADMAGNQDIMAALQDSCDAQQ